MSLAFICFYGQIRNPEQSFNSLKNLKEQLEKENYDVKIFAHLWYDFNEGKYENSRALDIKSNKNDLDFFLSEFKPTKVLIEQPRKFRISDKLFDKINSRTGNGSNIISQMYSRMKTRDLVKEYCDGLTDISNIPVFMMRLDFIKTINSDILKEYQDSPLDIFLAHGYCFNDNFIVLNATNFLTFFERFDQTIQDILADDLKAPQVYGWWCPESILKQRAIDMGLNLKHTKNIPDFK